MPNARKVQLVAALLFLAACRSGGASVAPSPQGAAVPPSQPPANWVGLLGEYGPDSAVQIVLERDGQLIMHSAKGTELTLKAAGNDAFDGGGSVVRFVRASSGRAARVSIGGVALERRPLGPESGNQLVVTPVRPIDELRREAMAATPPVETGPFKAVELVELTKLDPTIRLEIRYATSNNLFGTPFYTEGRAFMQRPAAEALVRVNGALRKQGYGLLIHDGYRPWFVTKMFWEAAPVDKRIFVADPAQGSKHNRGEAVDLTLFDLATGAPVEMPGTYDETTVRSYSDYPGGTTRQRWFRALLRRAMEAERFAVVKTEWWHFDYADWQQYPINNIAFDRIR
ncbi:MAG: M15 family metallopeptidase [Gemmatimonadota bacterium]